MKEKHGKIIEKALKDEAFRKELISNPKPTIEKELNLKLPEDLEVEVLEQDHKKVYLVLPTKKSGELSEAELTAVSGAGHSSCRCCDWDTVHPCGG